MPESRLRCRWVLFVPLLLGLLLFSVDCGVTPSTSEPEPATNDGGTKVDALPEKAAEQAPDTAPDTASEQGIEPIREIPVTPDAVVSDALEPATPEDPRDAAEASQEPVTPDTKPADVAPDLCANGVKDPGEVNTDCGGGCPACQSVVKQWGITWTLDQGYRVGTFANGDFWVLGPIKLKQIAPLPKDGFHGFEINPSQSGKQPYDKRSNGYDASLMPPVPTAQKMLTVTEGSIVSTISYVPGTKNCGTGTSNWPGAIESCTRSYLQSAAILTVLTQVPAKDSFRPPYMGKDKRIRFRVSDLDQTKLRKLAPVASAPSLKNMERLVERPWIDHMNGWSGAFLHPGDSMHNYGREIAKDIAAVSLMLNLDFSKLAGAPSKDTLLIRFVQLGLDLAGMVDNGQSWPHDGGHGMGRKLPILFAGVLLNDKQLQGLGAKVGGGSCKASIFQEDSTMFYISDAEVKMTASSAWNPDSRATPKAYTAKDKGIPEWGIRHFCSPARDNFHWGATYRPINGAGMSGIVMTAHIMGLKQLWAHPPLFDYIDRWAEIVGDKTGTNDWLTFARDVWKQYRDDYHCRWTRDSQTDTYSQGHYICGKQKLKCDWQQSTCSDCKAIKACRDYTDPRAIQDDPCRLKCAP